MREYTGEEIHRMVARFHTGIGDTMFQDMRLYPADEVDAERAKDKAEIENYRNEAGRLIAEYSVEIARLRGLLERIFTWAEKGFAVPGVGYPSWMKVVADELKMDWGKGYIFEDVD